MAKTKTKKSSKRKAQLDVSQNALRVVEQEIGAPLASQTDRTDAGQGERGGVWCLDGRCQEERAYGPSFAPENPSFRSHPILLNPLPVLHKFRAIFTELLGFSPISTAIDFRSFPVISGHFRSPEFFRANSYDFFSKIGPVLWLKWHGILAQSPAPERAMKFGYCHCIAVLAAPDASGWLPSSCLPHCNWAANIRHIWITKHSR